MSSKEDSIEFDDDVNGWIVKYRCPNCGRRYKVTFNKPKNRRIKCNYCHYVVKITVNQNSVSVS